jgi:internalin A
LPYCKPLHVSAKEKRGHAALEEALQDAMGWLRDPERTGEARIGAGRLRVQRRLEALHDADMALPREERRHRLMGMEEFQQICKEEGGVSSPAHLLTYLDANGTVFHRSGMFGNRIVLDQGWALEAIYAVFDRGQAWKEISRSNGRFTRSLLGLLVWRSHSEAEQNLFMSMMRSCGICFPHRRFYDLDGEDAEYIAPDLLPKRETIAAQLPGRWDEDRPGEKAVFRYAFLHGGLIRAIMAEIGENAGPGALYWQGGLCGFEATTGSRLLIEQEMTGDWQGNIRIQTQRGQAAALLDRLVDLVVKAQTCLGMKPLPGESPSPAVLTQEASPLDFRQEKPKMQEWYVSYAWGEDKTFDGKAREQIVNDLCAAATALGLNILRDKEVLGLGDSISQFMRRIGTGDRIFVILSDKYLRSPHCMFELSEIWRTSRQQSSAFLERVRIFALPDAAIGRPIDRVKLAAYWKEQHDELDAYARQHGATILGERDHRHLMQMQCFYLQVGDILAAISDIVHPRTFEDLERYGFGDTSDSQALTRLPESGIEPSPMVR